MRLSVLAFLSLFPVAAGVESPTSPLRPVFTPEESRWIAEHPRVRLGVDPSWPPFSFIGKDGRHQGIDAEMLALVSQRTGIVFELAPAQSWSETLALISTGQIDVVPGVAETPERAAFTRFTKPYLAPPVAVIMREDAPFFTSLRALADRRFAAPRRYVTTTYLQKEYPEIALDLVDDVAAGLERVAHRESDAILDNLVSASHLIRTRGLSNLKIVGLIDLRFELRFAVSKDQPELASIFDKALDTITERERHAIVERWIGVNVEHAIHWRMLRAIGLWVLLPGLGILLASGLWNRRLARELVERRKVEAALRERETALATANADLKQISDDRRTLMSMLAHDLYSPLSAVTLGCDYLRSQIPAQSTVFQRDLTEIHAAGERMTALVRDLLSTDAIEQGQRRFVPESLSLGEVVADIVETQRRRALAKKIALTASDATDGRGRVRCDRSALEQIVENLVVNALKFTPLGGRVAVTVEAHDSTMRLLVDDSGPGIPVAERGLVFQKFARLTPRPTDGESSSGMGLAIVRLLARAMQGEAEYRDAPGGGARFVVTLPAEKDAAS